MEESPRGRIIEEAKRMFFTQGYSKVLMADLARQLGMSKKTLYQYFSSKEELLNVIISQYGNDIQREVEHILKSESIEFPDKIKRIFGYVGTKLHVVTPHFVHDIKKTPLPVGNSCKSTRLMRLFFGSAPFWRRGPVKGISAKMQTGHWQYYFMPVRWKRS